MAASAADEYAKRLLKLSKHHFGTGETGHMERAMLQLKSELEASAKSHTDLAGVLRQQEALLADFVQKRDQARKTQQANVEKLWKMLLNQRQHVLKAKAKYQEDAIQINALHAQAALLQGRELDKVSIKLDKAQQTVEVNERDYRNYVNVLKETTVNWNMAWKTFCDLVQDQEEERLEFLKSRMWDYANGLSTLAMTEDECDPKIDVRIFVQQFGTGNAIPDPIPFVDVKAKEPAPKQSYKIARFTRSSTRIPGVKHSPSAVGDIARAMGQQPPPQRQQSLPPQQQQPSEPQHQQQPNGAAPSMQMSRSGSQPESVLGAGGMARPPSRSANRASQLATAPEQAQGVPPPSQSELGTPGRSASAAALESALSPSSRFDVSPAANLRARPSSEHMTPRSPSPSRPGHISASAFQNRRSVVSPSLGASTAEGPSPSPGASTAPAQYEPVVQPAAAGAPPAANGPPQAEDDEDDPLLKALKVLQTQDAPRPTRQSRSSVDLRGAAVSPSQYQSPAQQQRPPSRGHFQQPSFSASAAAARSRPTSPAPVSAAFMQAPQQQQQRPRSPSIPYNAPPPDGSHSRAGSTVSAAHLASPPPANQYGGRPSSPSPQPGRGRSPSPQPFVPNSLRPGSPNPAAMAGAQRAPSPSPQQQQQQQQPARPMSSYGGTPQRPPSGYGAPTAQAGYVGVAPQSGYPATAPPTQQQSYGVTPSQYARAASPAPRPSSAAGAPPPPVGYAPPQSQHQQAPQPYHVQAPSQHFQHAQQPGVPHHVLHSQPQHAPPPQHVASPPASYGYGAPPPQQQFQSPYPSQQAQQTPYARSPSVVGGFASPAQHAAALQRTASTHSGVSGVSVQQTPMQAYQAPMQQQQQQPPRAPSVADVRAGQAQPPPTGQHTDSGQPILFYVNALFDYAAASAEEFSFSQGDVIAVTGTDPDGWWHGNRVGDAGPSKLFPSNFTELLS
ncbi:hypothetical protein Rhopal_003440-T1 [Rhodotorula paludigena]|uniref:Cell division control protein 15 n=1 Tax=Rhodotorula paludigena TaxID=86838 RepID=A0AAV5GJ32_9BASI|nr:hypothetical protein Rhopal_003440-T1 [Rhodotorula paludigena]